MLIKGARGMRVLTYANRSTRRKVPWAPYHQNLGLTKTPAQHRRVNWSLDLVVIVSYSTTILVIHLKCTTFT